MQVRLVFQAIPQAKATLPDDFDRPLTYVQYFKYAGQRDQRNFLIEEEDIDMYLLKRMKANNRPVGRIIPLTDVARPIEIIPVYGEVCPADHYLNLKVLKGS